MMFGVVFLLVPREFLFTSLRFPFSSCFYFWIGLQCCQTHHDGKREGKWGNFMSFRLTNLRFLFVLFFSFPKLFWDGCLLAWHRTEWGRGGNSKITLLKSSSIQCTEIECLLKPRRMKKSRWNDQQVKSRNWLCHWQPRKCFVQLDLLWFQASEFSISKLNDKAASFEECLDRVTVTFGWKIMFKPTFSEAALEVLDFRRN